MACNPYWFQTSRAGSRETLPRARIQTAEGYQRVKDAWAAYSEILMLCFRPGIQRLHPRYGNCPEVSRVKQEIYCRYGNWKNGLAYLRRISDNTQLHWYKKFDSSQRFRVCMTWRKTDNPDKYAWWVFDLCWKRQSWLELFCTAWSGKNYVSCKGKRDFKYRRV